MMHKALSGYGLRVDGIGTLARRLGKCLLDSIQAGIGGTGNWALSHRHKMLGHGS